MQRTGSNSVPVAPRRRNDDANEPSSSNSESSQMILKAKSSSKRTFDFADDEPRGRTETKGNKKEEPRKRRSRWGDDSTKLNIPGLPTQLPAGLTPEQMDAYSITFRLEEIGVKLRTGNVVPPDGQRSPSPEPVYGADGKRVNTRDLRYRKKLEDERHRLVDLAARTIPNFRPPPDYRRPSKTSEKIMIPAKDHPDINFIGLLIGPRGNTLKKMEQDSGAKISIRGKGSVKEGKVRNDGGLAPGEEEDLHCLITADSEDKVKKAVGFVRKIIETASLVPEGQNELKRAQLRELASLNGTLRDDENQVCSNCGNSGHRKYDCPEQKNVTNNLICRICNGAGHAARDCMQRSNPEAVFAAQQREQQLDSEYANLMAELGETPNAQMYGTLPSKPLGVGAPWAAVPGITGIVPSPIANWQAPAGLAVPGVPPVTAPPPGVGAWNQPAWNQYGPPITPGPPVPPPPAPSNYGSFGFGVVPPPPPPPTSNAPPPPPESY